MVNANKEFHVTVLTIMNQCVMKKHANLTTGVSRSVLELKIMLKGNVLRGIANVRTLINQYAHME